MNQTRNLIRVAPVLWAANLNRLLDWYEQKLGFPVSFREGDEHNPVYGIVQRDGLELHFSARHPEWAGHGQLHLLVHHADLLHDEFRAREVEVFNPIADRDYGMRAFYLRDLENNFLEFGHNL